LARREAVDEAFLLAEVAPAIAGMIGRQHPLLRHDQPAAAIPRAPAAVVVDEGAGRPAVGVVAARREGIAGRVPALVDVVHLGMAVAVPALSIVEGMARLRQSLSAPDQQEQHDAPCSRDRPWPRAAVPPRSHCRLPPPAPALGPGTAAAGSRRRSASPPEKSCRSPSEAARIAGLWAQSRVIGAA